MLQLKLIIYGRHWTKQQRNEQGVTRKEMTSAQIDLIAAAQSLFSPMLMPIDLETQQMNARKSPSWFLNSFPWLIYQVSAEVL